MERSSGANRRKSKSRRRGHSERQGEFREEVLGGLEKSAKGGMKPPRSVRNDGKNVATSSLDLSGAKKKRGVQDVRGQRTKDGKTV